MIKSRKKMWTGRVALMEEMRNTYTIFVGKPEGKKPFGRPRHRWEHNITIDLKEIRWEGVDWIYQAQVQGPVVGRCKASCSIKGG
jgi:hypothetical protein